MKITKVVLETEDATDITTCAIEGGTGYWAECKGYSWKSWYENYDDNKSLYDHKYRDIPRDEVLVYIREDADQVEPEDGQEWFGITIQNLEDAVTAVLNSDYAGVIDTRDGKIDVDATGADVIFQFAKFGKVVYG
jgi:hypothetical protein